MKKGRAKIKKLITESLVFVIKIYQAALQPFTGGQCRFVPSCSEYAIESFRLFGPVKGGLLAIKRILRCRPLGQKGYDPPSLRLRKAGPPSECLKNS